MPQFFDKDPDAQKDYYIDWTDWLAEDETITSADWTASGVEIENPTREGARCFIWVSGGTPGIVPGSATCHIITNQGREDDRSIYFTIKHL